MGLSFFGVAEVFLVSLLTLSYREINVLYTRVCEKVDLSYNFTFIRIKGEVSADTKYPTEISRPTISAFIISSVSGIL